MTKEDLVLENFKIHSLVMFGKKKAIHEAQYLHKYTNGLIRCNELSQIKIISKTLKELVMRWNLNFPKFYVTSYKDIS